MSFYRQVHLNSNGGSQSSLCHTLTVCEKPAQWLELGAGRAGPSYPARCDQDLQKAHCGLQCGTGQFGSTSPLGGAPALPKGGAGGVEDVPDTMEPSTFRSGSPKCTPLSRTKCAES